MKHFLDAQFCRQAFWLVGLGILIQGCSDKKHEPLRFGINPWPGYEFIYLAKEKGFFKKNGVDVQLLDFASLNDNGVAYQRGQIDGMACSQIEMLQLLDKTERKPVAVFPTDYSDGADMILAADSLKTMKNLLHKKIAIEPGTLNIFVLSRALDLIQSNLDSVELVSLPQLHMPSQWKIKAFDAAVVYPPISNELAAAGMHTVFTSKQIPQEVLDILVFEQSILEERPEDVKRFLKAYEEAQAYWSTHRAESDSIMASHLGVSTHEFSNMIDHELHLCLPSERKSIMSPTGPAQRSLEKVFATLLKIGSVTHGLPAGKWVRDDFIP